MSMMNRGLFGNSTACLGLGEGISEYVLWFHEGQKLSAETLIRVSCAKIAACSKLLKALLAHPSISQVDGEQFDKLTNSSALLVQCFCEHTPSSPETHPPIRLGASDKMNLFKYESVPDVNPILRNITDTTISGENCLLKSDDSVDWIIMIPAAVAVIMLVGIALILYNRKCRRDAKGSSSDDSVDMTDLYPYDPLHDSGAPRFKD